QITQPSAERELSAEELQGEPIIMNPTHCPPGRSRRMTSGHERCSRKAFVARSAARRVITLPNKRLKLPGGDRFKGSGVLCPRSGEGRVGNACAGRRVARSLSEI